METSGLLVTSQEGEQWGQEEQQGVHLEDHIMAHQEEVQMEEGDLGERCAPA